MGALDGFLEIVQVAVGHFSFQERWLLLGLFCVEEISNAQWKEKKEVMEQPEDVFSHTENFKCLGFLYPLSSNEGVLDKQIWVV